MNREFDAVMSVPSPIGQITLASRNEKVVAVEIGNRAKARGSSKVLAKASQELSEFFAGRLKKFTVPVELEGTDFQKSVWREIAKLGFGKTTSYAEIATAIGKPKAFRAVGGAVGANPIPLIVGCHRVLGANRAITGYSGGKGIPTKKWLLAHEQIEYRS